MKNLKKILIILTAFFLITATSYADGPGVNLTIRNGSTIIFSETIPLQPAGSIELNGHTLDANSVLSVINDADTLSSEFSISNIEYYDSYGSFYLKCITSSIGNNCDNWQYTVNDAYPGIGMDKKILSGGENIYMYFGPQYKIVLSSNQINTNDSLTATSQEYDYASDSWSVRTGITIGLTQTNLDDPWSPTEIQTSPADANGQAIFSSIAVGNYSIGIKEDFYFPTENLTVEEAPQQSSSGGGGGSKREIDGSNPGKAEKKFDVEKALEFLASEQKENGSWGEDIYTDWVAISIASGKNKDQKIESLLNLIKYLSENKISGTLLTDFERRAMTLMSLGLNPYNTQNENYIKKITDNFDSKQFGDINFVNDDIFALIVLQNAGYDEKEDLIEKTITHILSKQKENGSWDESIDLTGAAIESLSAFPSMSGMKESLAKAKEFLKQNQKDDGGWGNVSSTAWAMEGIIALSEKPEDWKKNKKTPLDYLAENQDTDGGVKEENLQNRLWQTAYTITALSGKTWNQIMQKFEKPKEFITIEEKEVLEAKIEKILTLLENKRSAEKIEKKDTPAKIKKEEKNNVNPNMNTANVINSLENNNNVKKDSWLKNILIKIFSIF